MLTLAETMNFHEGKAEQKVPANGRFCDALNDRFENETGQARAVAHGLHFEISITRSCDIWPEECRFLV
jgi:hypothetical protein